jgi:L-serine deaminase
MAREEHGHAGILKMVRELVAPAEECSEIGPRLWSLVETVERCEHQALEVDSLTRALELAIRLESSELDALGHRVLQSMGTELPEGALQHFLATAAHCRRLVEAAEKVPDRRVRRRLEAMLAGPHEA